MSEQTPTTSFVPEPERFEFREAPLHAFELKRREFFQMLGAGIAVFAAARETAAQGQQSRPHAARKEQVPQNIDAWLHIGEDGTVTGFTGKAEIGQNIRTSLAQTIADELRVPFESVRMVTADTMLCPFDMGTFGSRSTPTMTPQLRSVAWAARDLLVAEAAKRWNVPAEKLVAADAKVSDPASGRTARYAELAQGQTLAKVLPADDPVTPPTEWTVAGKSIPKVDARAFVTGAHQYTPDVRLPGMLYGAVLRPRSFGATIASYDDSEAKKFSHVTIVRDGDFVGAAGPSAHEAREALKALKVQWKETAQISNREIFGYLKKNGAGGDDEPIKSGSLEEGYAKAAQRLNATYTVEYIAHTPLEPRAAVAEWNGGKLKVWMGTQRPFGVRDELASVFRLAPNDVRVVVPDMGSAYGGKHTSDAAIEAARLAKAAQKPVKVVWTREEEFTWAYFRPAGVIEVKGAIDADGKLTGWEFDNYHSGASGIKTPYAVANQRIEYHEVEPVLRVGSYRGLAATANHFARESHMDTMARAAKMDPVEFRMKNLKDERMRGVLEGATRAFGWPGKKTRKGQGFGVAAGNEKGSYVAACAEIFVDASGEVRIVRVTEAFECGAIVNPDGLKNQVVGAIIQGLGGALFEAVEFENGRILNARFSKYRVPRFKDVPEIQAVLLDRKDIAPAGAGETPIMAIAPAIGNAIFDATGQRVTTLPMAPKGLSRTKA
jgi:nicotinate dehydrogenase subunit B